MPITDSEGWISSDELAIPPQTLSVEEVDGFLEYVFSDIARQPEKLLLRETAGVVRYLRCLALAGVPSRVAKQGSNAIEKYWRSKEAKASRKLRAQADYLARTIWSVLLQCGEIKPVGKASAAGFLKRHRGTYLSSLNPSLASLDALVREFELPHDFKDPFRPPNMMGAHLTRSGQGNPRLQDDLTERIVAAYWGLKRAKATRIKPRIAKELDERQAGFQRSTRRAARGWTYEGVQDRLKNQKKRWLAEYRGPKAEANKAYRKWAHALTDSWIQRFRFGLMVDSQSPSLRVRRLPCGAAANTI